MLLIESTIIETIVNNLFLLKQFQVMADAQEESPSYPLPVGEIDLDDVTINNATMHKLSAEKGAFVNLGFSEEDDKASLKTLQAEASVTKSSLEASLQEWLRYLRYVQSNKRNIKEQIEERRDVLVKMINEHAEDLIRQSEDLVGSYEQQALSMKTTLTGTISEVSEFINNEIEGLQHNNNFKEDEEGLLKHCGFLVKQLQTIRKKTSVATPLWLPLKLYNKTESEYLTTHLFGNVRLVEQKDYPLKYCEPLSLLKRISTYYKHDQMPTGVVDMTVTATGNILVCDKLNKSLKMFTREGALDKVIKTGSLKDPNRITRWSHNNGFLVNDNYIRFIKMYDSEGDYVKDFLNDVKCPTSLCVNHLGDLLVTEYETKTILVFGPGGESKFSFKTLMGAPAHVSAGPRGHIVVTDWRHHTMKVSFG